jgi:hypothetical protein
MKIATLLLLNLFVLCAAVAQESNTEEIYKKWVEGCEDFYPNPDNPLYKELLKAPDGDLFFLKGLHHAKDPIRRLSRKALAELKTDRSFERLVEGLKNPNMFYREKCVEVLGDFGQPRCISSLLKVLAEDTETQVRADAAYALRNYKDEKVEAALLKALTDDAGVAPTAASSLGQLSSEKAIEPTYELIRKIEKDQLREVAVFGLVGNKNKGAVKYLVKLLEEFAKRNDVWGERLLSPVESALVGYAKRTEKVLGPVPDTIEQWYDWWEKAESLFENNMELKVKEETAPEYKVEDFGSEPNDLAFTIALDAKEYCSGDPIRLDVWLRNASNKPYRTVLPRLPSWNQTMAFGVYLKRVGEKPEDILSIEPSDYYEGSYWHPGFKVLSPGQEFHSSVCLQDLLRYHKICSLPEGSYELRISFDSSKFPGWQVKKPEVVHHWKAEPVKFTIKGKLRTDPKELLGVIGEKTGMKWLESDLTSRRIERRQLAWKTVEAYGDSRLTTFLQKLVAEKDKKFTDYIQPANLRPFYPGQAQAEPGPEK